MPLLRRAPRAPATPPKAVANLRRTADGKPDLQGFYESDAGGANYGLEKRAGNDVTPGGRGVIVDPPDGKLPMQPWAVQERVSRNLTERGYDDPTAHCFPAGVPRSMYVPTAFHIIQTSDYIVFLHERMSWRIVPLDGRAAPSRHDPFVAGRFRGPMGGRHAGCRYHQLERQDLAERGRRDCELRRARGGTIHSGGSRHRQLRGDRHRSGGVYAAVDDRLSAQAQKSSR